MFKKKIIAITTIFLLATVSIFSSESAFSAYVEGCQFYAEGDWDSANIMLKKAVSYSENFTPDVYYMLITSEVYGGDEKGALDDCNVFLSNFPDSSFYPRVKYHKGRLLYNLGEYEKAIVELSDFCHQYIDDELYSHALFYIGESLFAGYKYDEATGIFQRILNDFPDSEKAPAAQYRIDTILQRSREEKLLYLLKQTGEEYLSAKEEYEKQLKMYNADAVNSTKQKLAEAQAKNSALEKQILDLQKQLEALNIETQNLEAEKLEAERIAQSKDIPVNPYIPSVGDGDYLVGEKQSNQRPGSSDFQSYDEAREQLTILKKKALEAQKILETRDSQK